MKRAFSLCLLSPSLALAAVEGHVTDAVTGKPLAGVAVRVLGQDAVSFSAADGAWVLPDAPSARFQLAADLDGYEALVVAIPAGAASQDLALDPVVAAGEEVVVTASRYGGGVHLSQSNVTKSEIREQHVAEDVTELLTDIPGVNVSGDSGNGMGYTYLSLRGFDQTRVGVMVNGIPLNDPEDHSVYWVDLPDFAESLQDIQVQRGVTNAIGGPTAIGGTINLVTEVLSVRPESRAAFYAGSYNTSKEMVAWQSGLVKGRWATSVRLSHLETDGYREHSGTDQWAAFWAAKRVGARSTTQVNVYTGHEVSEQAWNAISASEMAQDRTYNPERWSGAVDDFRQPHYELHHTWRLSPKMTWENSFYYIHGYGFYDNFKEGETAADFGLDRALGLSSDAEVNLVRRKSVMKDQEGVVSRFTWDLPHGRVVAGGDATLFDSDHWGDVLTVDGFTPADLGGDAGHLYYDYTGHKMAAAGFVNGSYEVVRGITVLAEAHAQHKTYDFMQDDVGNFTGVLRNAYTVSYDFFNPKGGLFLAAPGEVLGGKLGGYGYVGQSSREPADAELFDTWDGPDDLGATPLFGTSENVMDGQDVDYVRWSDPLVEPEKVMDYEVGTSWQTDTVAVAIDGYLMDFRNEIVPYGGVNEDGGAIRGNANQTVHKGIEGSFSAHVADRYDILLSGSKSWDRYVDFTIYEDQYDDNWEWTGVGAVDLAGNPIAMFPEWLASARVWAKWGVFKPGIRYRGVGKLYLDNTGDEERTLPAYQVVDASCAVDLARWMPGATLDVRVNNVLGAEYATYGWYDGWGEGNYTVPAATRNWLAGVRYAF